MIGVEYDQRYGYRRIIYYALFSMNLIVVENADGHQSCGGREGRLSIQSDVAAGGTSS